MDGSIVSVKEGRFGPYINHRRVNVNLPSDFREDPSSISLMEAWSLIQEKASSGRRKNANRGKGRDTVSENIVLPPAPKRPKSAFLFFCNDKRLEVSKTTKSLGEISKELSRLWALTVDDQDARQIFEDLARKEKEEYMLKKKKWEQECQRLIDEASVSSGKQATASSSARKPPVDKKDLEVKIDIPKPKRPKSSYLFFCAEHRPSVSREVKSLGEISKELARLWAEAAGTDQRKKYEDMASADKIRYEIEMEEYNQARLKGEVDPGNGSIAGGQTAQKSDKMNHRARSAYMIFCSKFRNKIMDDDGNRLGFGETTKRLAQMWKDCDELKKAEFEAEAAKERLQTD
jgi:phage host-nuclease inhibitor protein Gam